MKLIIEGQELTQAIRRGMDFEVPRNAQINIIAGRGANQDRAEIEWTLANAPVAETVDVEEDPPFEVDEIDPAQQALPNVDEVVTTDVTGTDADPFS